MKRSIATAACAALAVLAWLPAATAQDLAKTAAKNAKVVLDNDEVRVIELNMPAGATTGMHSHQDHVVVFLTGGKARQTDASGAVKELERKAGDVAWSGPVTHDTKNESGTAVRTLVIELKK